MDTTRLSTKGQIILPKSIRDARDWPPGTEFAIEETSEGILLRPSPRFPATTIDQVAGCLRSGTGVESAQQMRAAIAKEVQRRHDRGRY